MDDKNGKIAVKPTEHPIFIQFDRSTDQISMSGVSNKISTKKELCFGAIQKRLPILHWLPKYSAKDAIGDLIAGFTSGITIIPLGLAYSDLAKLPPEFGLYGSFMGCFIYLIFGSCKDNTIGSTAVASLIIGLLTKGVWQRAVLLTFLTGCLEVVMAGCQLGFLADFVSTPVNAGFTSAVALIVFTSQLNNLMGLDSSGGSLVETWMSLIKNFHNINVADTVLGLICIVFLLSVRWLGIQQMGVSTPLRRFGTNFLWIFGIARNAVVVVTCGVIVKYVDSDIIKNLTLVGYIPPGVPEFTLPPFSLPEIIGNTTNGTMLILQKEESFWDMVRDLGSGLIIVPLVALLENTAVCRVFSNGKPTDASQELFAIGLANIGNSFFRGYRANGGLGRSAVNNSSGVRTPLANLYIGGIVVLALCYLTPYLYFIPKSSLAAMIISAVIFAIQYEIVIPMWKSIKTELISGFVAFVACLVFPLILGITVAVVFNLLFILYQSARPTISINSSETASGKRFLMLTPDRCIMFPSVEYVRNIINETGKKFNVPVVVDCTYIYAADFTAAKSLIAMLEEFADRNQQIIFYNMSPNLSEIFEGLGKKLKLCFNKVELELELSADETRL